jgi:hypothetical protein
LKRRASAIVQRKDGWYGIGFSINGTVISEVDLYENKDLPELKQIFDESCGVSVENSSTYLFDLTFPFNDKGKISLVLRNELEELVPFSLDDMTLDFHQTGKGKVLAAAIPKSLSEEFKTEKQVKIISVQSLAVLYALRWFNVIYQENFVFLHMNGNAVVIMAFKDNELYYLRQFFHSPQSDALHDAFEEIVSDAGFSPRAYFMISDNRDAVAQKEILERTFKIRVEIPLLKRALKNEDIPEWLWPGIGTALLSLAPRGQLNLKEEKRRFFLSRRIGLYATATLAGISLLAVSLFYLDYYFKQRTYDYLSAEPGRIYRLAFPKSPPARDVARMFQDKIKLLEKEPGSSVVTGGNPLAILNEVSNRIPQEIDVRINEFVSDEKEFVISGTTVSFASFEKFKTGIEQVRGISQVEVQNLELTANKQVRFKVRAKL